METTTTAADLSGQMIDAWNQRDMDRFVDLMDENIEWYDPAMPQPPVRGRAAVRDFAEAVFEAFPDFRYEVELPICFSSDGSRCAIPWRISATHQKPLRPMGFAPTGRLATFEGVDLLDCRGGKVTRIRTSFDAIHVAEQFLGFTLRPKPGTWRAMIIVAIQRLLALVARGTKRAA